MAPLAFGLTIPPVHAGMNDILIGIDEKVVIGAEGPRLPGPGKDAVVVMDVSDPARPTIGASLPLMNSLVGPPTNLQITPDGKLALVANSVLHRQDGDKWVSAPDDKLYVIDLTANPPKQVETITVGRQPSGLAITHQGDRALIANRAGKSITVLTIKGTEVRVAGELAMEDEIACVAITPDGKRAFACKNTVHKVAVLSLDGTTLTTDKTMDIPVAFNPYNIDITPDGKHAVVANIGFSNAMPTRCP